MPNACSDFFKRRPLYGDITFISSRKQTIKDIVPQYSYSSYSLLDAYFNRIILYLLQGLLEVESLDVTTLSSALLSQIDLLFGILLPSIVVHYTGD